MRPKLLKSFIVVLLFWFLFSTAWWTLASPETNYASLVALQKLLPFINLNVPTEINVLGAWRVQIKVLAYWTAPILLGATLFGLAGLALVWSQAARTSKEREDREAGQGNFRNVTITRGELPLPKAWPRDELDLGSDDDSALSRMTEKERELLGEVLGTLSAHPEAYPGEGVQVGLLEHALNLASKALGHRRYPGLSAIVAAGHELGKLEAYKQRGGEWFLVKDHDREAARILGTLPAWWSLPETERNVVMMAVKYHSRPRQIPDVNGDAAIYRQAREVLDAADGAQAEALTEEKTKTLEKLELPDLILESFIQALPQLSFQSRGLPKGVQAVAWKVKNRVYMLEIKLRDTVLAKLAPEVRGALAPNPKERSRLQPFTLALLKALDEKGWLVRKHDATKLEVKEALWNIKAGKLEFKGVIIIDVPDEYISQLPKDDSMYEVAITGTLFTPSASAAATVAGTPISKGDLLESVLKPAAPKPPAPPQEPAQEV